MNLKQKILVALLKTKQFPKIPSDPKKGKWYRIYLPGCMDSVGNPTYVSIKLGVVNKLIVSFQGGGAFWDEYTAARPIGLETEGPEAFYMNETTPFSDYAAALGIGSKDRRNPFRDWTIVTLNYSTGDFHVGDGDFPYTDRNGNSKLLHHHGYRNFRESMKAVMPYVGAPDTLLIAGASAGGFGASALAGEVRELFPDCSNVTCLVDGSLLLKDWEPVFRVWKAPEHISRKVTGPNYSLDMMTALHKEHPEIRVLFVSSIRDGELAKFQSFMDNGEMQFTKENGSKFRDDLEMHLKMLKEAIPQSCIYLYDLPYPGIDPALELTQHTIIQSKYFYDMEHSVAQWLLECLSGNGKDHQI